MQPPHVPFERWNSNPGKRVAQLKCRGEEGGRLLSTLSSPPSPLGRAASASTLNPLKRRGVAWRSIRLHSALDHPCVEVGCNQACQARSSSPTPPRAPAALVMRSTRTPKEARRNPKNQSPKAAAVRTACVSCATEYCRSQRFSGSQKKKKRDCRRASTCALLPVPPGVSAPRTPRLRKKSADSGVVAAFVCVCAWVCGGK